MPLSMVLVVCPLFVNGTYPPGCDTEAVSRLIGTLYWRFRESRTMPEAIAHVAALSYGQGRDFLAESLLGLFTPGGLRLLESYQFGGSTYPLRYGILLTHEFEKIDPEELRERRGEVLGMLAQMAQATSQCHGALTLDCFRKVKATQKIVIADWSQASPYVVYDLTNKCFDAAGFLFRLWLADQRHDWPLELYNPNQVVDIKRFLTENANGWQGCLLEPQRSGPVTDCSQKAVSITTDGWESILQRVSEAAPVP